MAKRTKNHCVYGFFFPNGKPYIGQTNNFKSTWNRHHNSKNKYPVACAFRKYSKENIKIKILHNCLTQAQANIWETIEIANHNSFTNGYNLTLGGYGKSGYKASAKTKRLIGIKSKERTHSVKTRAKIGKAGLGNQRALGSHPNRKGQHKGNQFAKDKHWKLSKETKAKHKENINPIIGAAKRHNLSLKQYLTKRIKKFEKLTNNKKAQKNLKSLKKVLKHISL